MNLKNYTSEVPMSVSIGHIERTLIEAGVKTISKEYAPNGTVSALRFSVPRPSGDGWLEIRLPADVEAVHDSLWLDYVGEDKLDNSGEAIWYNARKRRIKKDFRAQAERTAWKLMLDWTLVQLSLIKLQRADTLQVFLSYAWDGKQTFYQALKDKQFLQLTG